MQKKALSRIEEKASPEESGLLLYQPPYDIDTPRGIVDVLTANVIYHSKDFLAINKPPGLRVISDETCLTFRDGSGLLKSRVRDLTVQSVLDQLQETMGCNYLEIATALPKQYSGLILLSKSARASKAMRKYAATKLGQTESFQKFLVLSPQIPLVSEKEEIIQIKEHTINRKVETCYSRTHPKRLVKEGLVKKIKMRHKLLDCNVELGASLVSVEPSRVKWSNIELYAASNLFPVLGEHVYSARVKKVSGERILISPHQAIPHQQTLPEKLATTLGLPQKVPAHSCPLMIHRTALTLPSPANRAVPKQIQCPPQWAFRRALNLLKVCA